jgi:colanic acid biosynthesis glycosyl transferase WcaI
MRGPTVVFINRYFYPDHSATSQMLSDIAFALARENRRVVVITSRQRYNVANACLLASETKDGVNIRRVPTSRFGRDNLAGRALDYLSFYVTAAWALMWIARRGDIVIAKTDPPMLSIAVAPICFLRGTKLVNWLQDLFPEVAIEVGMTRGRVSRIGVSLLTQLRNATLRYADCNVVLGERMADRVSKLGVPSSAMRIIPNWADGSTLRPVAHGENSLRRAWDLGSKFVVCYSGNLGRAHEYATILQAIESLEAREHVLIGAAPATCPQIVWLFVGAGAMFEEFAAEAKQRNLKSVLFRPYQPRERLAESLSVADVHLVSLKPELEGLIVPSKIYGIAAVGRATIFIGDEDGEIARLIAGNGSGLTIKPRRGQALADAIMELALDRARLTRMGANARRTFETHYDLRCALRSWSSLLDGLMARPRE